MRSFAEYNPLVITIYFFITAGIAIFCMSPVILILSLAGALTLYFIKNGFRDGKTHLFSLGLFAVMALINPLVSHNGVTVLFVMNHNPVTLEALVYGIAAATMIVSVFYWFRSFSQMMTSDKLLYIFGALSPKLALILSMSLRYVPLFGKQAEKVKQTQKALGLYKEDNIVDNFKGGLRIFSVMITWALENGIITADSMSARGYGLGKRSRFSIFRFQKSDVFLFVANIILFVVTLFGIHHLEFSYYPAIKFPEMTATGFIGYMAYGLLVLLPIIIEVKEVLKWKYLKSKI